MNNNIFISAFSKNTLKFKAIFLIAIFVCTFGVVHFAKADAASGSAVVDPLAQQNIPPVDPNAVAAQDLAAQQAILDKQNLINQQNLTAADQALLDQMNAAAQQALAASLDKANLIPAALLNLNTNGGNVNAANNIIQNFDVQKAISFLENNKLADGSFGNQGFDTDWAAIAYAASNAPASSKASIISYYKATSNISPILKENETRAMALLALGQNPYSFGGKDYITPIVKSFDGTQFGDPVSLDDDIFAIVVLQSSGYKMSDDVLMKDIKFLLQKQNQDGSWNENIDTTASAIQALSAPNTIPEVTNAIFRAGLFLQITQKNDGGWGNIKSSSWSTQAMNALFLNWSRGLNNPYTYFGRQQDKDGGVILSPESPDRVLSTSYAIPAVLLKPWNIILIPVQKPVDTTSTTTATSTDGGGTASTTIITINTTGGNGGGCHCDTIIISTSTVSTASTTQSASTTKSNILTATVIKKKTPAVKKVEVVETKIATSTATSSEITIATSEPVIATDTAPVLSASVINANPFTTEKVMEVVGIIGGLLLAWYLFVKEIKKPESKK